MSLDTAEIILDLFIHEKIDVIHLCGILLPRLYMTEQEV